MRPVDRMVLVVLGWHPRMNFVINVVSNQPDLREMKEKSIRNVHNVDHNKKKIEL